VQDFDLRIDVVVVGRAAPGQLHLTGFAHGALNALPHESPEVLVTRLRDKDNIQVPRIRRSEQKNQASEE